MKNLLLLSALLFSATFSEAQISHDCKNEQQVEDKVKLAKTNDITLMIPMLGNISIKKAAYTFDKATMAFQVEQIKNDKDSVGYVSVDTIPTQITKEDDLIEANRAVKMED